MSTLTTERKLEIHYAEDRIRAEVAEEIARAIEDAIPSTRHFWDTADAARAYALNDAAKLARKHAAAPAQIVAAGSVVSTEGSGHQTDSDSRCAGCTHARTWHGFSRCAGDLLSCDCSAFRAAEGSGHLHPSPGPWTGPRPTLTTEGDTNANH